MTPDRTAPTLDDDPTARRLAALDPVGLEPPQLPSTDVSYAVDDTAVGRMLFAVRGGAVVASRFAGDPAAEDAVLTRLAAMVSPRVLRQPDRTDAVRRQVEEYLDGRRRAFDLPTDLALAALFQRTVLHALTAGVGYGEVTTYGELARAAGRAGAARAVGTALGSNPLCVVVPCHRVVAAGGGLSGYAGGPAAKRLLLDLEQRAVRARPSGGVSPRTPSRGSAGTDRSGAR